MCDAKQTIQNKQEITYSSSHNVVSESALRKIIPAAPALLDKRIQPTLDFFSIEFINQACVVILGTSSSSPMIPLLFKTNVKVENETQLILSNLPDNYSLSPSEHTCYASLFFVFLCRVWS